jgi:hypothetical protein
MIPQGYSPADRPRTSEEFQTGAVHELSAGRTRSSGRGAWITLAVVVLVIVGVVMLLSLIPETT